MAKMVKTYVLALPEDDELPLEVEGFEENIIEVSLDGKVIFKAEKENLKVFCQDVMDLIEEYEETGEK